MVAVERSLIPVPLGRDMPCPNCGHAWHSPFVCAVALDGDRSEPFCPCRLVPIPGVPT